MQHPPNVVEVPIAYFLHGQCVVSLNGSGGSGGKKLWHFTPKTVLTHKSASVGARGCHDRLVLCFG